MIEGGNVFIGDCPDEEDIIFKSPSYMIISPIFMHSKTIWEPNTDIFETSNKFVIKLEVAGMKSNNFNIRAHESRLIIKGERKDDNCYVKERYHQMEIPYGYFEKIFSFPSPMDSDNIKASYKEGFLEVIIPKVSGKRIGEITINIEVTG